MSVSNRKMKSRVARQAALKKLGMKKKTPKVRSSIKPGTVLILLSSGYRGKRVVCLKQLPSGLLLVTGPFCVNGVPLRRVNPRYVIATSTTIDVSKVSLDSVVDSLFMRTNKDRLLEKKAKSKDSEEIFVSQGKAMKTAVVSEERKKLQKTIDTAIIASIEKTSPLMKQYLKTRFTLRSNMAPHAMKF